MTLRFPVVGGDRERVKRFLEQHPEVAAQIEKGGEARGHALAVVARSTGIELEAAQADVAALEERSRILRTALVPKLWRAGGGPTKSLALQVKLLAAGKSGPVTVAGHDRDRVEKLKARIAAGVASCVDPAIISALIGAAGTAAIFLLLGIPASLPVIAIYFGAGTAIGRFAGHVDRAVRDVAARAGDFARRRLGLSGAATVPGSDPGRVARVKERLASAAGKLASPLVVSALVNAVGGAACLLALGIPFSLPAAAVFMAIGTAAGAWAPQILQAAHDLGGKATAVAARAREIAVLRLAAPA